MDKILLSIGHSQHIVDFFISLLKEHSVNYILDVRSTPYSQFASEYNRENIKTILERSRIAYTFMGNYFGARPSDDSLYSSNEYLDFEKVANCLNFRKAFASVIKGVEQGYRIAFMCTEKDPIECHRAILVTNAFYKAGFSIEHIMPDSTIQTQEDINERLLDMYYPNRNQLSLFATENLSSEQYLINAYKKQNKKIGYHIEDFKVGTG